MKECRAENPKFHNTVFEWKYDPCSIVQLTNFKTNKVKNNGKK